MNTSLCHHLRTNGTRCKSRALDQAHYCRIHDRPHEDHKSLRLNGSAEDALPAGAIQLHAIEGSESVQLALSVVINAVAAGTLDAARARVLLYGLQIASTNARHLARGPKAEKPVRTMETTGDSVLLADGSALSDGCLDGLDDAKNDQVAMEAGDTKVEAVKVLDEHRKDEQVEMRDEACIEGEKDADSEEAPSMPAPAHAHPSQAPEFSLFVQRTYEMEARSRLLAFTRRRYESAVLPQRVAQEAGIQNSKTHQSLT